MPKPARPRPRAEPRIGAGQKIFSPATLETFEAASASIPLRQLDRAFAGAGIRLGKDPGGPEGSRRAQFRRYVASVDQHDPQQRDRLGDVLGALIDEVATSKQAFLVKAAERDGFVFADGVFRPAVTAPSTFAITRIEELASLEERGRRLQLLAGESPARAIAGAKELVESVSRVVLRSTGKPVPRESTDLVDIVRSTLAGLGLLPTGVGDAEETRVVIRGLLQQFENGKGLAPRHARLAVGAAVAFAAFVAETYVETAAS